jgi:hypothetical protein
MPNENTQKEFDKKIGKGEPQYTIGDDDEQTGGIEFSKNLMANADTQVRENEDASLQDDTYAFDEDNTDNEEFHDMDDVGDDATDLTDIFDVDDDLQ